MRNPFDGKIHPATEEDLLYPDEASEIMTPEEAKEELERLITKKRKYEQRKEIKNGKRCRQKWCQILIHRAP